MAGNYVNRVNQRCYAKLESTFAVVPTFLATNAFRFRTCMPELTQEWLVNDSKTGSPTFPGVVPGGRRLGNWSLDAFLIPNGTGGSAPDMDAFFQASFGGAVNTYAGGTTHASTPCTTTSITFSAAQNLHIGDFIASAGEARCITALTGSAGAATQVTIAPPLTAAPGVGATIGGSVNYTLVNGLPPSMSIASYWDPSGVEQDIINGAIVTDFSITANGPMHMIKMSGQGQQVIDTVTFTTGQGGLSSFPTEPATQTLTGQAIAGHKGQAWTGATPSNFTMFDSLVLNFKNSTEMRKDEFGSQVPLGFARGAFRDIGFDFSYYETDDAFLQALRTNGKNRTPVPFLMQLGSTNGQMVAAYAPSFIPPVPLRTENKPQVCWDFKAGRCTGANNAELYFAYC